MDVRTEDDIDLSVTDDGAFAETIMASVYCRHVAVEQLLTDMHRDSVRRRFTGVQR